MKPSFGAAAVLADEFDAGSLSTTSIAVSFSVLVIVWRWLPQ